MLNKAKDLKGYTLHCLDGEIGKVKEFYFDDHHWTVRYLVAETGGWLAGRKVLISPYALGEVNLEDQYITVNLTKKQIVDSPSLDADKPVSRQFEVSYYQYYGWPSYWAGSYMWGYSPHIVRGMEMNPELMPKGKNWDPHLRSTHDVSGRHIEATDGNIGHVEDFLIDDKTWAIRYLVVDTRNWLSGRKVLISPKWVDHVSWAESKVYISLSRETIKHSPQYIENSYLTREYEMQLHRHYNRKEYWAEEEAASQELMSTFVTRSKPNDHQKFMF